MMTIVTIIIIIITIIHVKLIPNESGPIGT